MKKYYLPLVFGLAMSLMLAGCSNQKSNENTDTTPSLVTTETTAMSESTVPPSTTQTNHPSSSNSLIQSDSSPVSANEIPKNQNGNLSIFDIQDIALDRVGGGEILEIKGESNGGRYAYEIEILYEQDKYEIEIFADSGEFSEFSNNGKTNEQTAVFSMVEVQKIALEASDVSGQIVEAKLDADAHKYEIQIFAGNIEYEIEIDSDTGTILELKKD